MAEHARAVKAARQDANATYGSVTSRKTHAAWKAAEAKFAESLANLVQERADPARDEAAG
jgi:hypothetical protein